MPDARVRTSLITPVLMGCLSLAVLPATLVAPTDAKAAVAVFPPWWSQEAALSAADMAGDVTGVGSAPFIVFVRSDNDTLVERLRAAGALASLTIGTAAFCGGK